MSTTTPSGLQRDSRRSAAARHASWSQRHPFLRLCIRRTALGLLTLWVISLLIFLGTQVLPGDAAQVILGQRADPRAVAALREQMNLNDPILVQYWHWLTGLLHGDLGDTAAGIQSDTSQTVADAIATPLRNSLILAVVAVLIMAPLGILLGVISAARPRGAVDHVTALASLTFVSIPEFVIGSVLILVFGISLGVLPPTSILGQGETPLSSPEVLILPVLTIVAVTLAQIVRMVRACMIETLQSEYVMAARLAGISERRILWHYALRNALAPSIQVLAQIRSTS